MKNIYSIYNEKVKYWKKLSAKKEREKSQTFLIEGFHLIEEAVKYDVFIEEIIFTEETYDTFRLSVHTDAEQYVVSNEVFNAISDTMTPQGIAAVCKMPGYKEQVNFYSTYLLVDAVQDPGNLGTIIRTADAAGIEAVILGDGCVDIYNPKVIRSTQGSIFHLPIVSGKLSEWMEKLKERSIPVYGTALQNANNFQDIKPQQQFALLVGNEGSGVSARLLEETTQNLYVPIYGKSESLNVAIATGIILYHLRSN